VNNKNIKLCKDNHIITLLRPNEILEIENMVVRVGNGIEDDRWVAGIATYHPTYKLSNDELFKNPIEGRRQFDKDIYGSMTSVDLKLEENGHYDCSILLKNAFNTIYYVLKRFQYKIDNIISKIDYNSVKVGTVYSTDEVRLEFTNIGNTIILTVKNETHSTANLIICYYQRVLLDLVGADNISKNLVAYQQQHPLINELVFKLNIMDDCPLPSMLPNLSTNNKALSLLNYVIDSLLKLTSELEQR